MQVIRNVSQLLRPPNCVLKAVPAAGVKSFELPPSYDGIEIPERNRLRVVQKVPQYASNFRPFKTQKKLRLMRGPEEYHTTLLHRQYGIVATGGGRMKASHFEMIRMTILRNVDYKRTFGQWRVPDPWLPVTKKSTGSRMGSGKGSIDHYVTPVKSGQVIVELAGKIEYFEVSDVLKNIARRLPFDAIAVSQEIMEKMAEEKRKMVEENLNPWTWKYIIQNNMLGCHKWISKYDVKWFKEYL